MASSNEVLKALFAEYEEADKLATEKKAIYDEAMKFRSAKVEAIAKAVAPVKSINVGDKDYTIVARDDTFFLRSPKGSKVVIKID